MYKVAILGASNRIGIELLEVLEDRKFPLDKIILLDTQDKKSSVITFNDSNLLIKDIVKFDFSQQVFDFVFVIGNTEINRQAVEQVIAQGAICIASSSFQADDIPIIIPEINLDDLQDYKNKNIVLTPNCTTTIMLMALAPLHAVFDIKRIVVSTYQSVSGAGNQGLEELFEQTYDIFKGNSMYDTKKVFSKQIAFNLIPHIGDFLKNGNTKEEESLIQESKRFLGKNVAISATCIRVPTFISHALSLNIEFNSEISEAMINNVLAKAKGVSIIDHRANEGYVTPVEVAGDDKVYISRIRLDESMLNTVNMWVISDNLRKGMSLNMVQIVEEIINLL